MKFHLITGGVKQTKFSNKLTKKFKEFTAQLLLVTMLTIGMPTQSAAAADNSATALLPASTDIVNIQFDLAKSQPLTIAVPQAIGFTIGESVAQAQARQAAEAARAAALAAKVVQTTSHQVTNDPGAQAKRDLVLRAASAYNVPWEVLEAVWQVESGKRWDTQVRSYAGAQGPAQFMPATWRRYGVDGNGDGVKDINSAEDAIYGAANYLAANGANRGDIYRALFAYNHADWYVQKVLRVAREIGYTA